MGIPTSWTAHSTRGAGVLFYKNRGFSAEQVCELGAWKNAQAFTSHYLRLGAAKNVGKIFSPPHVHKTSPDPSAEPDWSQTPGRNDQGGSDREGEAQRDGEPNPPSPKRRKTQGGVKERERASVRGGLVASRSPSRCRRPHRQLRHQIRSKKRPSPKNNKDNSRRQKDKTSPSLCASPSRSLPPWSFLPGVCSMRAYASIKCTLP